MSDLILVERDGYVAAVTLNRPAKLNALTKPMWKELGGYAAFLAKEKPDFVGEQGSSG
jgi:enoyl-CoA hydratase/carnithine racemase